MQSTHKTVTVSLVLLSSYEAQQTMHEDKKHCLTVDGSNS